MRIVWASAWQVLQVAFAGRGRWLRMFLLPALAIYLVGLAAQSLAQGFTPALTLAVRAGEDTPAIRAFLDEVARGHASLRVRFLAADETPTGTEAATVIVPAGFGAALDGGAAVTLTFIPGAGLVEPEIAFAAVRNALLRLSGPAIAAAGSVRLAEMAGLTVGPEFRAARQAEAEASWQRPPLQVLTMAAGTPARVALGAQLMENGFRLSVPGIAAMFVMISLLNLAQGLSEERTLGILRRVEMMPVRRWQVWAGRLLAAALMGWSQFAAMLGFGVVLGVRFGAQPWPALVVAAAYALAIAALSLILADAARSPRQAGALATAAWLVLAPLGGAWWPLLFVPDWLRILGHLSPVAWCLDALNALVFGSGGWGEIMQPVGVLLLFAAAFSVIAATRFDYGQAKRRR